MPDPHPWVLKSLLSQPKKEKKPKKPVKRVVRKVVEVEEGEGEEEEDEEDEEDEAEEEVKGTQPGTLPKVCPLCQSTLPSRLWNLHSRCSSPRAAD